MPRAGDGSGRRAASDRARQRVRRAVEPPARAAARRLGFDLVRRTMYSPVPDVPPAASPAWSRPHPMPGVPLDLDAQLDLLGSALHPYLDALPSDFPARNRWYEAEDATVLFAMIRHLRPRVVLELGSGHSTLAAAAALEANAREGSPGRHVAVDPEPRRALPPSTLHRAVPAQEVPLEEFLALEAGDVLFLDTTHTVKLGSEVNRLVLEVLPLLAPGVVVHVHDVFLPYEYPRAWLARGTYLAEQYLVHAFLCENPCYEVVLALHALARTRRPQLTRVLPCFDPSAEPGPSAFWVRRVQAGSSPARGGAVRPDWLVLTALESCRARVRPRRRSEPRLAGVLSVRNYSDACSAFESLRELADVTIVLDDNSNVPFPFRDRCDEYLALQGPGGWNDVANKTLLMQRAYVHGCEWLVCIDDDIVFSHGFQTRADVGALVAELEGRRADVGIFPLRDLWETTGAFRADGIWARKTFNVLRRNWLGFRSITFRDPSRRLHSPLFPRNMRPRRVLLPGHVAYHTGCLTREARAARVEKYRLEDPGNVFQADYSYMLRDEGIRLEAVPEEDVAVLERKITVPAARAPRR